jgi:hypothetical protein
LAIGLTATLAAKPAPDSSTILLAILTTVASIFAVFVIPIAPTEPHAFSTSAVTLALLFAIGPVSRAHRRSQRRDAMSMLDDDQRALFARDAKKPAPPPPRSTAAVKFACSRCGELTLESELKTVDGERICSACLEA